MKCRRLLLALLSARADAAALQPLYRCSAAAALSGSDHLDVAKQLLNSPQVLDALIEAEFDDAAPVLVPLCWSSAAWSESELEELQWPPLVEAARRRSAEMRALSEAHAQDSFRMLGRFAGARALLVALEFVHCHALACDGELWLLPERARFARSAPHGAVLERCPKSGDLMFVGDAPKAEESSSSPPPPSGLSALFFLGTAEPARPAVTVSSGRTSNDNLLQAEGWADEALECDHFPLPEATLRNAVATAVLGKSPSREALACQDETLQCLRRHDSSSCSGDVLTQGGVSRALLHTVQALCLSEAEVAQLGGALCAAAAIASGSDALPSTLRPRAERALAYAARSLLSRFATTLDEDAALLQRQIDEDSGRLSEFRRTQCIRSRLSRKRCLAALHDAAEDGTMRVRP